MSGSRPSTLVESESHMRRGGESAGYTGACAAMAAHASVTSQARQRQRKIYIGQGAEVDHLIARWDRLRGGLSARRFLESVRDVYEQTNVGELHIDRYEFIRLLLYS